MENDEIELNERSIINVLDTSDGRYKVVINQGSSVEEVAFAISVIIKVFHRDEVIKQEEMLELINTYLNAPQYEEVPS